MSELWAPCKKHGEVMPHDDRAFPYQCGGHEASPAEVLAHAATLDGAEVDWRCVYGNPLCKSVVFSVGIHSKCGPVLVIPLPDKETTDG